MFKFISKKHLHALNKELQTLRHSEHVNSETIRMLKSEREDLRSQVIKRVNEYNELHARFLEQRDMLKITESELHLLRVKYDEKHAAHQELVKQHANDLDECTSKDIKIECLQKSRNRYKQAIIDALALLKKRRPGRTAKNTQAGIKLLESTLNIKELE